MKKTLKQLASTILCGTMPLSLAACGGASNPPAALGETSAPAALLQHVYLSRFALLVWWISA